ncbi:hypothetical protein [Serratia inhibens]
MKLLTNDTYFRAGFESLISVKPVPYKRIVTILDDGVEFLYFIASHKRGGEKLTEKEAVPFFLQRLALVIPRETKPEKLEEIIQGVKHGTYQNKPLTLGERKVLLDMSRGVSSNVSRTKLGMKYKTWHSFKASGFKRLGIKNDKSLMRVMNVWNTSGHKMF